MRLELGDATPGELADELRAERNIPMENGQAQEQAQPRTNLDLARSGEDHGGDEGDEEGGAEEEVELEGSQKRPYSGFNLLEASTPSDDDDDDDDRDEQVSASQEAMGRKVASESL